MSDILTGAELAEIAARLEGISEPPWSWREDGELETILLYCFAGSPIGSLVERTRADNGGIIQQPFNDGRFIAAAPTDIQRLLASHAALVAKNTELKRVLRPFVRLATATLVHPAGLPHDQRAVPWRYIEAAHVAFPELDDNDD